MIDSKYDTYKIHAMDEPGQFWSIISPGKEYVEALTAFSRVRALAYFRTYYTALNGIRFVKLSGLQSSSLMYLFSFSFPWCHLAASYLLFCVF